MGNEQMGELPTLRQTREQREAPAPGSFMMRVVQGPDMGLEVMIDDASPARVLVGKSPLCDVRLHDPEVSRRHLSMRPTDKALELLDLGSTNGTTVNGVLVREVMLVGGEAIRLGSTVMKVARVQAGDAPLLHATSFGRMYGESRAMRKVFPVLEHLARLAHPVLIEGEPGTGKELAADELHHQGPRRDGPFAVLETETLSADEIGARLFGQGGLAQAAAAGTLFIDEVANLPLDVQAELSARIQDPHGRGPRLVLGTRRDLDRDVSQGRFREELLHRLAATRVALPPLRERSGDVRALAERFWAELVAEDPEATQTIHLPPDLLPRFDGYAWPGNVRELLSAVESRLRLGELASFDLQGTGDDPRDFIDAIVSRPIPFSVARRTVMQELERRYVTTLLQRHGGNVTRAAAASGLAHRYFKLIRARTLAK